MEARRLYVAAGQRWSVRAGESRKRPGRSTRRLATLVSAVVGVLILAAACSPEATHRMLTFFYDGVPPLDADLPQPDLTMPGDALATAASEPPKRVKPKTALYSHPAYKEHRCEGCHDLEGGLLKTARQGLCRSCHPDKPPKKKFVHGPVAVNGCLACHRYHKSPYPKILITDAQSLCFLCHVTEELTTDEHHATMEEERCIDCHDAHGGDDRFFLIRKPETVGAS